MVEVAQPPADRREPPATRRPAGGGGLPAIAGLVVLAVLARPWLQQILDQPAIANWATIFVAVAGAALPGCECGSVPVARRLMSRGVAPSAALAVGWWWAALGRDDLLIRVRRPVRDAGSPVATFLATAQHDFLSAGGFLVVGAAAAATLQTVVPRSVVEFFADSGWWSVLALALLAVLLAICSEADAFVAASLRQFSPTAQLAFLVVGPMVDVKLIAMQAGTFGRAFALRFVPVTFACALGAATLFGWWLL